MSSEAGLPPLSLEPPALRIPDASGGFEWLETDGHGGYAMGTAGGPRARRYHGLLCVAAQPPLGRMMLVNALGETFVDGQGSVALDSHHYPGALHPDGIKRLARFSLSPWPRSEYAVGSRTIVRELAQTRDASRTIMRFTASGDGPATLIVRPLCSGRDSHALHQENVALVRTAKASTDAVEYTPYPGAVPGVRISHNGTFTAAPDWYRRFQYPTERERGLDFEEDLFCPGELRFDLSRGPAFLVFELVGAPATPAAQVPLLFEAERARRSEAVVPALRKDPIAARLASAARAFVVKGPAERTTVIAGYPWFTDWGRDTFISARGLGLAFGPALERELLLSWEPFLLAGMIPNRFPEGGGSTYNAVDASLWYALRCGRHLLTAKGDVAAADAARLRSAVRRVIEGYLAGTQHGIHVDDDGLVHAADPGQQLTWMDAKVDGWVVTPRAGKPVEVQALWVGVLEAGARLFQADDRAFAGELAERAAWARSSFAARFWCESRGHLYDVIDGPMRDYTLRPNQLYALGLVTPLVDPDRAGRALAAVERELLTPVGLRSRERGPGYRGQMTGDPRSRDGAYHEGTVWAFLIGIYADACQRVRRRVPSNILEGLVDHLTGPGLGQLAEVFDGDAPHRPRGCPAQAWSVAEALRVRLGAVAED